MENPNKQNILKNAQNVILKAKLGNRINKFNQYIKNKRSVSDTSSPEEIAKINARNNFTAPKDLKK